jgi:hypothetical protein
LAFPAKVVLFGPMASTTELLSRSVAGLNAVATVFLLIGFAKIKAGDWNEYRVVAKGGHLQHFINGVQTVDVTDETAVGAKKGLLALQLHAGPPMVVQFKDLILKEIK